MNCYINHTELKKCLFQERKGKMASLREKFKNGIYGVAVGDALGGSVQFSAREELRNCPVEGMKDGEVYPAGTFSDDTSMTLALAESLGRLNDVNYEDIMENFVLWLGKGKFTSDGKAWDQGFTCVTAIKNWIYRKERNWPENVLDCGLWEFEDNGNGSLMRILPVSFYIYAKYGKESYAHGDIVRNISKLTHAHQISQFACEFYCNMIYQMLDNSKMSKKEIFERTKDIMNKIWSSENMKAEKEELKGVFNRLFSNDFEALDDEDIQSGGYVVHSLEAALWCFLNSSDYRECTLKAVNLGHDADTTAAIAGGLAGIFYGEIPREWLNELRGKTVIEESIKDMAGML